MSVWDVLLFLVIEIIRFSVLFIGGTITFILGWKWEQRKARRAGKEPLPDFWR